MENSTIEKRVVGRTDVYIGIEIIPQIVPRLRSVFEEGALVVVYENECESVANALMQELKKDGYRVFATSVFDGKTWNSRLRQIRFLRWRKRGARACKETLQADRHGVVYAFVRSRLRRRFVRYLSKSSVY